MPVDPLAVNVVEVPVQVWAAGAIGAAGTALTVTVTAVRVLVIPLMVVCT